MADHKPFDSIETTEELEAAIQFSCALAEERTRELTQQLKLLVLSGKFGAAVPLVMSLLSVGMALDLNLRFSDVPPSITLHSMILAGLGMMVSSRLEKRYLSFVPNILRKKEQSQQLISELQQASDALAKGEEDPRDIKAGVLQLLKQAGIDAVAEPVGKR
jgi:hypothetical protein